MKYALPLLGLAALIALGQEECQEAPDNDGDGWTVPDGDCDDANADIHPGATELPNGIDDDCDGEVDEDIVYSSCLDYFNSDSTLESGTYAIDPDGETGSIEALDVYCDMSSDGGGWTLLEVGYAQGTNLRTHEAVGMLSAPDQSSSAKLDRDTAAAILMAGEMKLKFGRSDYGFLYTDTLEEDWVVSGYGSPGYGTEVTPYLIMEALGGSTYSGSRFAWPFDGMVAACLNSDGGTGECGAGLHIGTWAYDIGDNAYVNYSSYCCNLDESNTYAVWAR